MGVCVGNVTALSPVGHSVGRFHCSAVGNLRDHRFGPPGAPMVGKRATSCETPQCGCALLLQDPTPVDGVGKDGHVGR